MVQKESGESAPTSWEPWLGCNLWHFCLHHIGDNWSHASLPRPPNQVTRRELQQWPTGSSLPGLTVHVLKVHPLLVSRLLFLLWWDWISDRLGTRRRLKTELITARSVTHNVQGLANGLSGALLFQVPPVTQRRWCHSRACRTCGISRPTPGVQICTDSHPTLPLHRFQYRRSLAGLGNPQAS